MDRRSRRLSSEPSFPVTSSTQRIYNAGLRRFEESGTFSSSDSIMSTTESSAFVEENENGPASISAPPHAINNNDSHNIDAPLDDSVVVIRGDGRRDSDPDETSDISCMRMMSYGVGHFYNDLCASMWFTYLLMFMEKVLKFQSYRAGMLMLIGQVTDAICTPLVGIASDKSTLPRFMRSMGRRKAWHLIGTICVTVSFPFIFNKCLVWNKAQSSEWWSEWVMFAWFVPFIMIFQFGWAAVQISHLALIPELSKVDSSRTTMNSLRYAFTVLANVAVFGLLALFLSSASTEVVEPADLPSFRNSGFIVVGMGLVVSIIFHLTTREPVNARRLSRLHSNESTRELMHMTWKQWFLQPQFYQIGLLYMTSRLYCNISQVYFPFYITQTQKYDKKYVAIFPMTSYVASFAISTLFSFSFINRRLNRKAMFMFGGMCCMANCAWMYFSDLGLEMMYPISCLLGIGQAIVLVSSLDITADLINRNTESGAFVYGAMSLVDKFANGVAYQIIEIMNPSCDPSSGKHEACRIFYRNVMVFVPAACMLLGVFVLISLIPQNVGHRPAREGDHRSLLNDNSTIYEE